MPLIMPCAILTFKGFFTMIYMKFFIFLAILSTSSLSFSSSEETPYERFRKATQLAELAYKDLGVGNLTGIDHVTLEGIKVHTNMTYGDSGTSLDDYLSDERSGFRGYIMEHGDETIIAISGTKNPLHMILDLHIMFATAGDDPKKALDELLQKTLKMGFATRTLVSMGISALSSSSEAEKPSAVSATASSSFPGAVWEATKAATMDVLPQEIKALYKFVAEGDGKALQEVLQKRFEAAVIHTKTCIQTAMVLNPEQKLRVVGHSLGGALATVAMAQLHSEEKLNTRDFEVNAICSPGSLQLLKRFETPIDEGFSSKVFTLVREGDIVSNFGEHIGRTVPLPSISDGTLATLKGGTPAETYTGLLSYFNPMAYGASIVENLMHLKYIHSSVGAILDVENILRT
jgi:hypothetical protein